MAYQTFACSLWCCTSRHRFKYRMHRLLIQVTPNVWKTSGITRWTILQLKIMPRKVSVSSLVASSSEELVAFAFLYDGVSVVTNHRMVAALCKAGIDHPLKRITLDHALISFKQLTENKLFSWKILIFSNFTHWGQSNTCTLTFLKNFSILL